jgi:hypothetical protein
VGGNPPEGPGFVRVLATATVWSERREVRLAKASVNERVDLAPPWHQPLIRSSFPSVEPHNGYPFSELGLAVESGSGTGTKTGTSGIELQGGERQAVDFVVRPPRIERGTLSLEG